MGATLGEPTPGDDDVGSGADDAAGGADDAVPATSSLHAAAPNETMPKDAAASRVATLLTAIPFTFTRSNEWDGARDVLVRTGTV